MSDSHTFALPIASVENLPEALPLGSSLEYSGTVDGTALVRCASSADRVMEAVELIDAPAISEDAKRADLCEPQGLGRSHPSSTPPSGILTLIDTNELLDGLTLSGTSHPTSSSQFGLGRRSSRRSMAERSDNSATLSPQEVLLQGGGVIFTEEFVQQHPTSSIASVTREYSTCSMPDFSTGSPRTGGGTPSRCGVREDDGPPLGGSSLDRRNYLHEVFCQQRPIFRRVDSQRLYGHGYYLPPDSNHTATHDEAHESAET